MNAYHISRFECANRTCRSVLPFFLEGLINMFIMSYASDVVLRREAALKIEDVVRAAVHWTVFWPNMLHN